MTAVMVLHPAARRKRQGTSTNRKRLRCSTTSASISDPPAETSKKTTNRTIHAHVPRSGIVHRTPQNGRTARKRQLTPQETGGNLFHPRSAIRSPFRNHRVQRFEDGGNIARIVLSIAIYADHIFVAQLIRQPVSGLNAAAQAEMMRESKHLRACGAPGCAWRPPSNLDNQDGGPRHGGLHFSITPPTRLFVECRNQNQNPLRVGCHTSHLTDRDGVPLSKTRTHHGNSP